jgi:ribonuclease P protein component
MPKIFTYQKKDKLKSRKQTQNLFSNGKAIGVFPIKLIYTIEAVDTAGVLQAGVGAPTRTFRKAVQRNRVKRLLREAYRLEKPSFLAQFSLEHKRINLFFLYGNAEVLPQAEIQDKVRSALAQLAQKLNAN